MNLASSKILRTFTVKKICKINLEIRSRKHNVFAKKGVNRTKRFHDFMHSGFTI